MTAAVSVAPAARYYRSDEGAWSGVLAFDLVDWRAWRRARLGFPVRLATLGLWLLTRVRGLARLETIVDCTALEQHPASVLHKTWLRVPGLTLMESVEVFTLAPGGAHADIKGHQQYLSLALTRRAYTDSALQVDAAGSAARYRFRVDTARWEQSGRITPEGVVIELHNPRMRAEAQLRRQPATVRDAA